MIWYDLIWYDMIWYDICACVRVNRKCWKTMENHRCWLNCHVKTWRKSGKTSWILLNPGKVLSLELFFQYGTGISIYCNFTWFHGMTRPPATATGDLWRPGRQPLPLRRAAACLPLRLRAADVLLAVPPWMVGLVEVLSVPCFRTMV